MREIKFRAWDKGENKWLYAYENLGGFDIKGELILFGEYGSGIGIDRFLEDVVIMQYTGLKDKNGKEIYESDVIRWRFVNTGEDEEYYEEEVKWYECGFFLDGGAPLTVAMDDCEVIGNVHQNPEILNQ